MLTMYSLGYFFGAADGMKMFATIQAEGYKPHLITIWGFDRIA